MRRRRLPPFLILPSMLTLTVHSDSSLCINFVLPHLSTKAQTLTNNCSVRFCDSTALRGRPMMAATPKVLVWLRHWAITTSTGKLQLTKAVKNSIGRALYSAPIHIWDSKTGDVANFETLFTFAITAPYSTNVADGLAFFLAPVDTQPQNIGRAGFLGVFNSENYNKSIQTVAVEIDTFHNTWDPKINRHIGINVNSIKSISTTPWVLENGREANVVIRFDSHTNVLSVVLSYPGLPDSYILSDVVVPLKDIVPEWVRIGFSAATGAEFAEHDIRYWSFHSELSLVFNNNNANVSSSVQTA